MEKKFRYLVSGDYMADPAVHVFDGKLYICLLYTSRKSNTEPIIRVYSEAATMEAADEIGQKIMDVVYSLAK